MKIQLNHVSRLSPCSPCLLKETFFKNLQIYNFGNLMLELVKAWAPLCRAEWNKFEPGYTRNFLSVPSISNNINNLTHFLSHSSLLQMSIGCRGDLVKK